MMKVRLKSLTMVALVGGAAFVISCGVGAPGGGDQAQTGGGDQAQTGGGDQAQTGAAKPRAHPVTCSTRVSQTAPEQVEDRRRHGD